MGKALENVIAAVPAAVKSLESVPKVGFDSKVAAQNWVNARDELKANLESVEKYVSSVKEALDASARSDGLGEFLAPTSEDFKKKKRRK